MFDEAALKQVLLADGSLFGLPVRVVLGRRRCSHFQAYISPGYFFGPCFWGSCRFLTSFANIVERNIESAGSVMLLSDRTRLRPRFKWLP